MTKLEVNVDNQVGLHSRPATFFHETCNAFKSVIWVENGGRRANGKSYLGLLSLGIVGGMKITIIADGEDEKVAVEALGRLVELMSTGSDEELEQFLKDVKLRTS